MLDSLLGHAIFKMATKSNFEEITRKREPPTTIWPCGKTSESMSFLDKVGAKTHQPMLGNSSEFTLGKALNVKNMICKKVFDGFQD